MFLRYWDSVGYNYPKISNTFNLQRYIFLTTRCAFFFQQMFTIYDRQKKIPDRAVRDFKLGIIPKN